MGLHPTKEGSPVRAVGLSPAHRPPPQGFLKRGGDSEGPDEGGVRYILIYDI